MVWRMSAAQSVQSEAMGSLFQVKESAAATATGAGSEAATGALHHLGQFATKALYAVGFTRDLLLERPGCFSEPSKIFESQY